jgi:hypothetical protein
LTIQLLIGLKAMFSNSEGPLAGIACCADIEASMASTPLSQIAVFPNEINHENEKYFFQC